MRKKWWLEPELNRRHKDFQSSALPTELSSHHNDVSIGGSCKRFQNERPVNVPYSRHSMQAWKNELFCVFGRPQGLSVFPPVSSRILDRCQGRRGLLHGAWGRSTRFRGWRVRRFRILNSHNRSGRLRRRSGPEARLRSGKFGCFSYGVLLLLSAGKEHNPGDGYSQWGLGSRWSPI